MKKNLGAPYASGVGAFEKGATCTGLGGVLPDTLVSSYHLPLASHEGA